MIKPTTHSAAESILNELSRESVDESFVIGDGEDGSQLYNSDRKRLVDKSLYDLAKLIEKEKEQALWDLYEYMGQFPDDLNLAVMYERIKEITND